MAAEAPRPVELRPARVADLEAVAAVERDASLLFAAELPSIAADDSIDVVAVRSAMSIGRVVVAVSDDAVVGYAWWSVVDGDAHLEQVSITGSVSGRGVGRRLIDRIAEDAGRAGFDELTLTTFRDLAWNAPLYGRYGFTVIDEPDLAPELQARRKLEAELGLDIVPRVAMRRVIR